MLKAIDLKKIIFLDIETVPVYYRYAELTESLKELWDRKWLFNKESKPEELYQKAGVYAEFAKIICISTGYFHQGQFRMRSFYGEDEYMLLKEFSSLFTKRISNDYLLCAHNGKEFDFPFICRRMLLNGIPLPDLLDISGKKPWEVKHLDTMELWKFGDYKSYTSLNLLANIFGLPTPKDEIDGSDVSRVFYEEKDIEKIVRYCRKDVVTVARILQKFIGVGSLKEEDIIFTD